MSNKENDLEQIFKKTNSSRKDLAVQTRVFQELVDFMDHKIRKKFQTFTLMNICGSQRSKFMIDLCFEAAFGQLQLQQKIEMYEKTIRYALEVQNSKRQDQKQSRVNIMIEEDLNESEKQKEVKRFRILVQKGFRTWNQIHVLIEGFKVSLDQKIHLDLRNYLLRKSKKTDRECYVLEAIRSSEPQTIRFCFFDGDDQRIYLNEIKRLVDEGFKESIERMLRVQIKVAKSFKKIKSNKIILHRNQNEYGEQNQSQEVESSQNPNQMKVVESIFSVNNSPSPGKSKSKSKQKLFLKHLQNQCQKESQSLVDEILKNTNDQNLAKDLSILVQQQNDRAETLKQNKVNSDYKINKKPQFCNNIFSKMFPFFNLTEFQDFTNFKTIQSDINKNIYIFQNITNSNIFKIELLSKLQTSLVLQILYNVPFYKHWHSEIHQSQVKLCISSENCAIMYQKHRQLSKWYRQRDFLYLQHIFKLNNDYYISSKSIQNTNFVPFPTIQRGRIIYQIIKITDREVGSRIIIEGQLEHGGLIGRKQCDQLTIRYMRAFANINQYFANSQFHKKLLTFYDHDWTITNHTAQQSPSIFKKVQFANSNSFCFGGASQIKSGRHIDDNQIFFSILDDQHPTSVLHDQLLVQSKKSLHEIEEGDLPHDKNQFLRNAPEIIVVNQDGLIIVPNQFIKKKHPAYIIDTVEHKRIAKKYEDFLRRDHWTLCSDGGFKLINKQIISAQDSVLSFIMSTLRKNIFSGKGALNISLPVTIFNCDSNLQRLCLGLTLGPQFLQKAALTDNPIQRMKYVFAFGLTNSLIYFDIQKPFNPILGQTYQGFIAGCPVYAEQISHHPPISALYMIGRGYKLYASLEGTVNIHINSGDGANLGWYHVLFQNGQQICFQTPPAQFSGFAVGDRKFHFKQKGYYIDKQNLLYGEMAFQDYSSFLSKDKWKYKDQIYAQLFKVTQTFMDKFVKNFNSKKSQLKKQHITQRCLKLQGRWPIGLYQKSQPIFQVNKDMPYELIDYQYPLSSNSNYREDLYYRRKNDLSMSQSQKQRLQNQQRNDRKLRQKYNNKKH